MSDTPPLPSVLPIAMRGTAVAAVLTAMLAMALLAGAAPALAEKADRDRPINVEADRMQYDDVKQVSTFTGRVVLTKGTIEIRADRLTVRQDAEGWQYGTAWGELASFRQKREGVDEWIDGRARRIDYDGRLETVRLQQQAMMQRTDGRQVLDEIHGGDILYESRSELFTVDSAGSGAASPVNPSGRVRMVIQPRKPADAPPAEPPARLKPAEQLAPATR